MGMANHVPAGKPPTVVVTVVDEGRFGARYTELVKENRRLYANKHGTCTYGIPCAPGEAAGRSVWDGAGVFYWGPMWKMGGSGLTG